MRARDLSRARTLQIANRRPQQSSPGAWTSSSCASKAARTTALQGALLHRSHAGTPDRASRRDRGQLRMAPIHCITWGSAAACNCKAPSCDYTGINSVCDCSARQGIFEAALAVRGHVVLSAQRMELTTCRAPNGPRGCCCAHRAGCMSQLTGSGHAVRASVWQLRKKKKSEINGLLNGHEAKKEPAAPRRAHLARASHHPTSIARGHAEEVGQEAAR